DGNESAVALAEVDPESVTLTLREAEILQCLTRYSGPMGIAENLGLSVNTVKTHLRSVYRKLGVSNRNDALATVQRVIVRTWAARWLRRCYQEAAWHAETSTWWECRVCREVSFPPPERKS